MLKFKKNNKKQKVANYNFATLNDKYKIKAKKEIYESKTLRTLISNIGI